VIAYLEGTLVRRGTETIVAVAGGGVALELQVPTRAAEGLPAVGELVKLWTHLAVREDAWTLYGFPTVEEREMFRLLISVSGVGPRVALGMLSGASPAEIARHLRTGDERSLARLPGIGKKSAARLVVELGQRVPEGLAFGRTAVAGAMPTAAAGPLTDALAVLGAMGLPGAQGERALVAARADDPGLEDDVERWVKAALRRL
jgi:Holliday junction DNA helicase RuvA